MSTAIEQIRAALAAGPTPGPWTASNRGSYGNGDEGSVYGPDGEDTGAEFVKPIGNLPTIRGELWYRDAVYVAACNPEAITELLAERDALAQRLEAAEKDAGRWRWLKPTYTAANFHPESLDLGNKGVVLMFVAPDEMIVSSDLDEMADDAIRALSNRET